MASEEIGFPELRQLARQYWKLILGLGLLFGVLTLAAVVLFVPEAYLATSRLVLHPPSHDRPGRSLELYQSLLESATVRERAAERLAAEGVLDPGSGLKLGRDVTIDSVAAIRDGGPVGSFFLTVAASSEEPGRSAAIANAVAEEFVAASREMLGSGAARTEGALGEELSPTRVQLEELETERSAVLDGFQEREESTSTDWDRRIAAAKKSAASSTASYQSETRAALAAAVRRFQIAAPDSGLATTLRAGLQDLVAVRAQLAQTPRILSLEKAVSDETLAEMIVEARDASLLDTTLISQEANQLYEQLSIKALEIEGNLKTAADAVPAELAALLEELEEIQQQRTAGLTSLLESASLEVRTLRRRRSRALEDLGWEKETALAELDRRIKQLATLENQLVEGLNEALVTRLLDDASVVELAAPAIANPFAEPRDLPIKVAAGAFLGAMLGLMLALFRSGANG